MGFGNYMDCLFLNQEWLLVGCKWWGTLRAHEETILKYLQNKQFYYKLNLTCKWKAFVLCALKFSLFWPEMFFCLNTLELYRSQHVPASLSLRREWTIWRKHHGITHDLRPEVASVVCIKIYHLIGNNKKYPWSKQIVRVHLLFVFMETVIHFLFI